MLPLYAYAYRQGPQVPIGTLAQLAHAVRSRRIALGLSQGTLAERADVSRLWINEFEGGKPTAEVGLLLRVLDALDLDLEMAPRDAGTAAGRGAEDASEQVDLDDVLKGYSQP